MDNFMNDNKSTLNGLDQNEKHSYSVRHQNAGDGPEIMQNSLNDNISEKNVNHNNLIESVNNNHTEKVDNENQDFLVDDLIIEDDQNLVNYTKGLKSISQNDQLKSKGGIGSNRTFSLTSSDNLNITETVKNIIQLIDKLNSSNELIKQDLTAELDKLGSLIVPYEQKFNSRINSKLYDIQEIQTDLEHFIEQLSKAHILYEDIQSKINRNMDCSLKNYDKKINKFKHNKVDKVNENSEEDDILSVEELSWDDYNMILANTAEKHKNDKNNAENNSSLINLNKFIRSNEEKTNNQENQEDNFSVEESLKTQNSTSFTLPTNNHLDLPSTERSNSFQEIKSRFENLKNVESKVSVRSSITSAKPNCTKTERKHHSISKKCVSPHTNSTKINSKNIKLSLNNNDSIIDDLVDNSAFLVSSIDSYTESVSLPIPMKRLNSHSTLYGNNTNHTLTTQFKPNSMELDEKTNSAVTDINYKTSNLTTHCHNGNINNGSGVSNNSLVAIDFLADQSNRQSFVNMPNKNCDQELTNIIKTGNVEEHSIYKIDQYIEIVNGIRGDNQVYIESPYIIPKESEKDSLNVSSDHIIAMGKQTQRNLKPRTSDSETSKISCSTSNYNYAKDLVETERLYVNQLFILSQVLYNRIKAANIISLRNFNIIFPPILHKMYKFHMNFCKDLDLIFQQYINLELSQNNDKVKYDKIQNSSIKTSKLGQTFLGHIERDNWSFFSMYRQYYSRLPVALNIYNKLKRNSHKFDRLIKSLQHNEHCHGLDLAEFILLPIQRLPKYLMILRKILSNLTSKETEEKVSILAVEHLLYSFLTEYEKTDAAINLKRVRNKHHISSHNDYNWKYNPFDKINNNVTISNNCNKTSTEQINILSNLARCENIRNVLSQSTLMPDQNGIANEFIDTDIKFCSPKLNQISSVRDSQKTSESIPQIDSGTTGSLESIHYYHQSHIKTFKSNKSDCNIGNEINRNENNRVKYLEFSNSHNSIHRPISVPPPFDTDQSVKPKKSPKDFKLHLSTDKLKYHTTDECSVCLNSQDEFEIDTSLEDDCGAEEDDEDDKTCRAAPCHINKQPINNKLNMSDSIIRRYETNSSSSLNLSPNKISGIIEFCSPSNVSKEHINLTNSQQPLQMKLTDSTSYVLFSDVIPKLTESIIDKKVTNIVTILSHVVLETMDHDLNDRKLSSARSSNFGFENVGKHPNHSSEESLKKSTELSNDFDDKNNSKKFSLRHLFSLKKRNKFDNYSNEYTNTKSPSTPSVPLRKRMSINESSRKNQNH